MTAPRSQAEHAALLEGLASPDEEVRRLSVEQILSLPIEEAIAQLVERLGDEDWRVRKAVVERFIACRDHPPALDELVGALADGENSGRRNSAYEALVRIGSRATERLLRALASEDIDVRKLVVDALAAIGDPHTRGPLSAALSDADPNVRASVAEALGVVGGVPEIGRLIDVASDLEEELLVRLSALRALTNLEASIGVANLSNMLAVPALRPATHELLGFSSDPAALDVLIKGLSEGGRASREAAMGALLRRIATADREASERLRAQLRSVSAADASIVEFACDRLETAELTSRMVFIQFLGLLGDARSVVPILRAGRDEAITELCDTTVEKLGECVPAALEEVWPALEGDLGIRACAVLGRIGGEVAERLLATALDGPDAELRCEAAAAIGEGGLLARMPHLVRCLEVAATSDDFDAEDEVEALVSAIESLAEASQTAGAGTHLRLIEMVAGRLAGASEPVRLAFARILARVGREQDEDIIGYLLKDVSSDVRRSAVGALARFPFDAAHDALRLALGDESVQVRMAAARVLGECGQLEAAGDLKRLMHDEDPRVIAVSVSAMGRLFAQREEVPDEVFTELEGTLASEPALALTGIDALCQIGGERVASIVRSAFERTEAEVVRAAVICVGKHASAAELEAASALLGHSDWSVRAELARMLAMRVHRPALPALLRRFEVEEDAFVREAILDAIRKLEE